MTDSRSTDKQDFWRWVIAEQRRSGLTIKAFCKQQGLSEPSFYGWRRRLEGRRHVPRAGEKNLQEMIPVSVVGKSDEQDKDSASKLEVISPSGFRFTMPDHVCVDRVAKLAVAIESAVAAKGARSC
ncbi:MAG: hypothetical protein AAFP90_16515 [Planctomycetota bacterium]